MWYATQYKCKYKYSLWVLFICTANNIKEMCTPQTHTHIYVYTLTETMCKWIYKTDTSCDGCWRWNFLVVKFLFSFYFDRTHAWHCICVNAFQQRTHILTTPHKKKHTAIFVQVFRNVMKIYQITYQLQSNNCTLIFTVQPIFSLFFISVFGNWDGFYDIAKPELTFWSNCRLIIKLC